MKSRLLSGLEGDLKNQVEREYSSSTHLREQLKNILTSDVENIQRLMREDEGYSNAAWPFKQAEKLGETKALLKLVSLLK